MAEAQTTSRPASRKIGIMTPILGVPLEKAAATAREWGFDGIEIVVGGEDAELARWSDPAFRKQVRDSAREVGCLIPSFCPGVLNEGNLGNPEAPLRERAGRILSVVIEAAADVGAGVILVPFFGEADLKSHKNQIQRMIDGIKPFAAKAEKARVTLALETTLPAGDLLEILKRINSPAVKIYYDISNMVWQGYEPAREIRQLGSAIAQVHIKDNVFDPAGWAGFRLVPLGQGRVDFASSATALRGIGYTGWLVLEVAVSGDHRKSVAAQLQFVREHFE